MKNMFFILLPFFLSYSLFAQEKDRQRTKKKIVYKTLSYKEKCRPERGLTFKLTFDKSINADYAKGNATPTAGKEIELSLRGIPGYDDKMAFKLEKGERLEFGTQGNVDHRQGTIIMWVKAENYSPKDIKRGDPDNCHKAYITLRFKNGKKTVTMFLYQYWNSNLCYFYWNNWLPARQFGRFKLCPISLQNISQGEWFQIAATWDNKEIRTYLNGEYQGRIGIGPKAEKALDFKPDPKESAILIRRLPDSMTPYDYRFGKSTLIDDISIYDYPMTGGEVKKRYLSLIESTEKIVLPDVDIQIHGVYRGGDKLNKIEVDMDFSTLPDRFAALLQNGKLAGHYSLYNKNMRPINYGIFRINEMKEALFLCIDSAGEYKFKLELHESAGGSLKNTGKQVIESKSFTFPDTSFIGNKIGKNNSVPKPWIPVELESGSSNVVKVWNRKYFFKAEGPFPDKIEVAGKNLLKQAPKLIIQTPTGIANVNYTLTEAQCTPKAVTLTGTGKTEKFTLSYRTTVEYDGLIRTNLTLHDSPEIESMKVAWIVNPEFSRYFMTPLLSRKRKGKYPFPGSNNRAVCQLWLTSEQGGFCWAPESDANWVYKEGEKVIKVELTEDGGYCELEIITQKTRMPADVAYQLLFIATPTRPISAKVRAIHMGSGGNKFLLGCQGEGQTAFGEYAPDPVDFSQLLKSKPLNSVTLYTFADSLTESSAIGRFYRKYWEVPGTYIYPMPHRYHGKFSRTNTISCCLATPYSDYLLANMKKCSIMNMGTAYGLCIMIYAESRFAQTNYTGADLRINLAA